MRGPQLPTQLTHQPPRPGLLSRWVPTCRRLPRCPFVPHDSLGSKVKSLQKNQGDSVTRVLDPTCKGRRPWVIRWEAALIAFAITFEGRINPSTN